MVSFEPTRGRREIAGHLMWFLLWLAVTVVALWLTPNPDGHGTHRQLGFPPCPSVLLFDKPCPGCGLTTSFTATVHGQLIPGFKAHPLGPLIYGIFSLTAFACLYGWWTRKRFRTDSAPFNYSLAAAVVVFLVFGATRFMLTKSYSAPGDYQPLVRDSGLVQSSSR
ncbi:MAG TPA: DUF2752 domain-containing protein [Fimbriimonadaceae bacterium]|nr:DUF2752 domain-containing protein [Fimbriimonadaceae bacterium]